MLKSKIVLANNLGIEHSSLRSSNIKINQKMKVLASSSEKDAKGDPAPNTLTVNMTFSFSNADKHGNMVGVVPINIPGNILFSMTDNYLYKHSHDTQLDLVQKRHSCGFDKKYHKDAVQQNGPAHYDESYYNQKFHHSEQALYTYLSERSNLDHIASQLKARGVFDNTTITTITIDMHSVRYVCGNCEIGGFGLMNPSYAFKDNLSKALLAQNLVFKSNAQFYITASAEKPDVKGKYLSQEDHVDVNLATLKDAFIECDANIADILIGETDLHLRTAFVSTKLKENGSYNTLGRKYKLVMDEIKIDEYAKMIAAGAEIKNLDNLLEYICREESSKKNIKLVREAFTELFAMEDSIRNVSSKVLKDRAEFDSEIKLDHDSINKVKKILLSNHIEQKVVSDLSLKSLKNMRVFVDNDDVKGLIKLMKSGSFINQIDTLSQNEVEAFHQIKDQMSFKEFMNKHNDHGEELTNFILEAMDANMSLEENFEMNFSLYVAGRSIAVISSLYDACDASDIENLYDAIRLEITNLTAKKLKDFVDHRVVKYIQALYEDEECLSFDELSAAYDEDINMFWDIICDPDRIGAESIINSYRECNSLNRSYDSAYEDEYEDCVEAEYDDYDDPFGLTPYDRAVQNEYDDYSYDCTSIYEDD